MNQKLHLQTYYFGKLQDEDNSVQNRTIVIITATFGFIIFMEVVIIEIQNTEAWCYTLLNLLSCLWKKIESQLLRETAQRFMVQPPPGSCMCIPLSTSRWMKEKCTKHLFPSFMLWCLFLFLFLFFRKKIPQIIIYFLNTSLT